MVTIKVFSTKNCHACEKVKAFLKEHHVKFQNIDVSEDAQALTEMIERTGQMKVPVTEIDGELFIGAALQDIGAKLKI